MKLIKILIFSVITITTCNNLHAKNDYFNEGITFFEKKEFKKAKFKFEQALVFNPKHEQSYLYLSKIFNKEKKNKLEKQNLKTVILLNPKNEEAIYSLSKLMLKESDYNESKKLVDQLLIFCKNYCEKGKALKVEINKSIKK